MPERFDSVVSSVGVSATGALGFDFDFRGAFTGASTCSGCVSTCSGWVSFLGEGGASSSVVVYIEGRLGRMSSPACCNCFAYSFLSFAFSIRLRLIWMAVRERSQRGKVQPQMGDACVLTLAAMGSVGQVLGSDGEALFVFPCGAIGGRIVARAFCDCHCVIRCV
jgi:hypothetical protein